MILQGRGKDGLLMKAIALEQILAQRKMVADIYLSNASIRNYMIITFSYDPGGHGRGLSRMSVHKYSKTAPMMTKK